MQLATAVIDFNLKLHFQQNKDFYCNFYKSLMSEVLEKADYSIDPKMPNLKKGAKQKRDLAKEGPGGAVALPD